MPRRFAIVLVLATFVLVGLAGAARASNSVELRYADHRFTPASVKVPAGRALTLRVVNASKQTIEFESFKLNREKVLTPGETIIMRLPALSPGSYDFYDDFHEDVPQGHIVAR
jgi:plastocyanin